MISIPYAAAESNNQALGYQGMKKMKIEVLPDQLLNC